MNTGDALAALADVAAWDDPAERSDAAAALARSLGLEGADAFTVRAVRNDVKARRLLMLSDFDALVREGRQLAGAGNGNGHAAPAQQDAGQPADIAEVPGSPGWAYRPARGDDPGALYQFRARHWQLVNPWAPAVARVLESPNDVGEVTARYFEVGAGGRWVLAAPAELDSGEVWHLLPVPGTSAKAVRAVLANIVLAEGGHIEPEPALTRTGWHGPPSARFYVFADGRTSDGRRVRLVGPGAAMDRLALAAAPVEPSPPADVAAALVTIAGRAGGPGLAGLGIGVRSIGQSLHKVLGGYVFTGKPNAGKSNAGWTARLLLIARPGRADAWPPLASATFADTPAYAESVFNTEADMPTLLDDAALHSGSTRAAENAMAELVEKIYRPLANDAPVKGRSSLTMLPRASRYIRSPVISTVQEMPMQNSLRRRVLILPVEHGDIAVSWYRGPDAKRGANAAALVRPLRTLGEHLVIPHLAALGEAAPGYLAERDGDALAMLGDALAGELPGWQSSSEGLAGVVGLAAAVLAGVLIAADVAPDVSRDVLTETLVPYLVRAIVGQAAEMTDAARAEAPGPALADAIRFALVNGRAHVRDERGVPAPVIEGLSEQEHGLERIPGKPSMTDDPAYRGRGVPLYWVPALGGLGASAATLHKLITDADDSRLRSRGPRGLPSHLAAEGLSVPSDTETGPSTTHQKWINGANARLVVIRAEILSFGDGIDDGTQTSARSARSARTQTGAPESNGGAAEGAWGSARQQVESIIEPPAATLGENRNNIADLGEGGSSTSPPAEVLEIVKAAPEPVVAEPWRAEVRAYLADCAASPVPLNPRYHPTADGAVKSISHGANPAAADAIREAFARELADGDQAAAPASAPVAEPVSQPELAPAEAAPAMSSSARPPSPSPGTRERGPAFLVWDGGELAHAPEGELVPVPPGSLAGCRSVGDVAGLAIRLGCRRLWLTRAAREALGLPAELPETDRPRQGVPHPFAVGADPERWDIWPGDPVGLGGWMTVYTLPRSDSGAHVVFPEWLDAPDMDGVLFGELAPAELAHALTLIWRATTFPGKGGRYGGVHFHHSPQATFKQLVAARMRRSQRGIPESVSLPPVYAESARTRGAALTIPGPHMAPAQEIPAGYVLAALDVNSCYLAAARGTDFGVGEWRKVTLGRIGKEPGIHLCNVPAGAAAIHPALMPWFPVPKRGQREVRAWLDSLAALWLAERGVPLRADMSYIWPEADGRRVFDSPVREMLAARDQLGGLVAAEGAPARLARDVIKAGYVRFFGGWLGSDFGGERRPGDWSDNRAWWLRIRVQAEVRKQRNLVPMLAAGAVVLGQAQVDTVWLAAPSLDALAAMPGTGNRPAVADGPGKFKLAGHAVITPELAARLADGKAADHVRRDAIRAALDAGKGDQS
jgi:hypothetical protein